MGGYNFRWYQTFEYLPQLLRGAMITLEVAAVGMFAGIVIGTLLAICRNSGSRSLRVFATTWIELARNTPSLFQVYIIYFGAGAFHIYIDSYPALLIGVIFNCAGYLAENFRAALGAIPNTQIRAGRSLGMGAFGAFYYIAFPQMLKVAFPSMTNQFVWAVLMSSLGVVVGVDQDLMGVTQYLNAQSFRTFELYAMAAIIYYVLIRAILLISHVITRKIFDY